MSSDKEINRYWRVTYVVLTNGSGFAVHGELTAKRPLTENGGYLNRKMLVNHVKGLPICTGVDWGKSDVRIESVQEMCKQQYDAWVA